MRGVPLAQLLIRLDVEMTDADRQLRIEVSKPGVNFAGMLVGSADQREVQRVRDRHETG